MKTICLTLLLLIWLLLTVVLALTLVGMVLFIPKDQYTNAPNTPSTWMTLGRTLLDAVIYKK